MTNSHETVLAYFADPRPEDLVWVKSTLAAVVRKGIADARELGLEWREVKDSVDRQLDTLDQVIVLAQVQLDDDKDLASIFDRAREEIEDISQEVQEATLVELRLYQGEQQDDVRAKQFRGEGSPDSWDPETRKASRRDVAINGLAVRALDLEAGAVRIQSTSARDRLREQAPNVPDRSGPEVGREPDGR